MTKVLPTFINNELIYKYFGGCAHTFLYLVGYCLIARLSINNKLLLYFNLHVQYCLVIFLLIKETFLFCRKRHRQTSQRILLIQPSSLQMTSTLVRGSCWRRDLDFCQLSSPNLSYSRTCLWQKCAMKKEYKELRRNMQDCTHIGETTRNITMWTVHLFWQAVINY